MFTTPNDLIKSRIRELQEPENLYEGVKLPRHFALPDNILLFYHDFAAAAPVAHCRYTLVFPLASMRYYVDQQKFDIKEGDVLLIPPYSRRFMDLKSSGYQRFFITFELPEAQSYLPPSCLNRLSGATTDDLKKIFDLFPDGNPAELSLALWHFLTHLSPETHAVADSPISSSIAAAIAYINDNLHLSLQNSSIAAKVNMSVSNLVRRFRRETGMTLHEYIAGQRLELGRYHLLKTRMRTEEIARCCGFLSGASFSHFFTARTGLSPLAYRKKVQETEKSPIKSASERKIPLEKNNS
ncbi:MAG: helix-turn-helix transcriptional regulator [Lentisphaerae bacterium]|nr:helix-turn-helix transcriptional regulator [Lentisphaerota bacterium]